MVAHNSLLKQARLIMGILKRHVFIILYEKQYDQNIHLDVCLYYERSVHLMYMKQKRVLTTRNVVHTIIRPTNGIEAYA